MIREMVVAPVVLEGQHIRLEPLQKNHLAGLAAVGLDPELWRWIPRPVRTIDEMAGYIETALREKEQGDRKSTRLNSSHRCISYAVFCLKKKKKKKKTN